MTDWRGLCAELLAEWDSYSSGGDAWDRARAALALPVPVGRPWPVPGDAEGLAEVFWGNYDQFEPERPSEKETFALWSEMRGAFEEPTSWRDFDDIIRAALTRWGRPAAQQLPVSSDNLFGVPAVLTHDSADNPVLLPMLNLATTSEQIPPGPYSEHELRTQWNAQADEFNQWESLDLSEQLAWAQARAIAADRKSHAIALAQPEPSADGEVAELVAALEADAECVEVEHYDLCNMTAEQMRRAATLLQQLSAIATEDLKND
jgi:hypothetical protein